METMYEKYPIYLSTIREHHWLFRWIAVYDVEI